MPTDQHTDTLVVSQLAREAAVSLMEGMGRMFPRPLILTIAAGQDDAHLFVQAFARFEAQLRSTDKKSQSDS